MKAWSIIPFIKTLTYLTNIAYAYMHCKNISGQLLQVRQFRITSQNLQLDFPFIHCSWFNDLWLQDQQKIQFKLEYWAV